MNIELIFVLFVIKHFIIDFPLQTPYQFLNKGTYIHPGGLLHSGLHGIGTIIIGLTLLLSIIDSVLLGFLDSVLHYHIDWAKVNITKYFKLTINDYHYWNLLGLDQLLHYLTYVGLITIIT